jgi:hypothetical protein
MNEHGILFLKQKNVSKTHRRNYAATTRRFSVIFALDFFLMGHPSLSTLAGENEAAPVKRVLVLNSYHPSCEWSRSIMRGIESVFANTDIDVLCSYEHMDTHLAKLFSVQLLPEKIRCNYLDIRVVRVFLAKSLACLGLAILLFVTQTITKLSPGVAAIHRVD